MGRAFQVPWQCLGFLPRWPLSLLSATSSEFSWGWGGGSHSTEPPKLIIQTQLLNLQKCEPSDKQFLHPPPASFLSHLGQQQIVVLLEMGLLPRTKSICALGFFSGWAGSKKRSQMHGMSTCTIFH